jgi:hypothetical protein
MQICIYRKKCVKGSENSLTRGASENLNPTVAHILLFCNKMYKSSGAVFCSRLHGVFFLSKIKIEVKRSLLWSALLGPSNSKRAWAAVRDRNSRGRELLPPQESSAEMPHFLSPRGTYGIVLMKICKLFQVMF